MAARARVNVAGGTVAGEIIPETARIAGGRTEARVIALLGAVIDATQWNTVLYHSDNRKDIDLSAIAKQFPNGGGHKGAAGLRSPHPPWDWRCWENIHITQEGNT